MNKKCDSCNDHFKSNGELTCSSCRVKTFNFTTSKRNFYKDRRSWDEYSKIENAKVIQHDYNKASSTHLKPAVLVVGKNLSIHSTRI